MRPFGSRLILVLAVLALVFWLHQSKAAPAQQAVSAARWAVTTDVPSAPTLKGWLGKVGVSLPGATRRPTRPRAGSTSELPVIIWPMAGAIVTPFGVSGAGPGRVMHTMVEVEAPSGTPVRAASAGVVLNESATPGGKLVRVADGPYTFIYQGLGSTNVSSGRPVKEGQTLGVLSGASGSRSELGFEIEAGSTPLDPAKLLPRPKAGAS